jgi:hexulose-6-phosphate isomerase
MNEIGIMQGRLSPPAAGRLQAFPWTSWEQEFHHARACGLDCIEWIFEGDRYEQNPIWTVSGSERVRRQIEETGIPLRSICADYFIEHPFFRVQDKERSQSVSVLKTLILKASGVGIRTILMPVLEEAEIRTPEDKALLTESLKEPLSLAASCGIRLGLETELPARDYRNLVEGFDHPALGVYYDTGNAAARGYDIAADIRLLGPFLFGVHIKDRKRGGPSVLLGEGDADFAAFFKALGEVGYTGPLILQTAFGEDYLRIAGMHLEFVKERMPQKSKGLDPVKEVRE